ncbi:MAG: hypothetical protein HN353_02570 [Bdellovibrionales bacterium]|nr:hypothetical protein [Bdellovibrionales bacterium]MBT3525570.1 hypothetical protein [Bdellovibrionales bacterium]MBT7767349.1 hypothetical protein [Bdellovibrionales bacterium]
MRVQWLICILLLITSCATTRSWRTKDPSKSSAGGVVSIESRNGTTPLILSKSAATTNMEFGPQPEGRVELTSPLDQNQAAIKRKVITLIFSPGLVRAVGQIALIRELEQQQVDIHIVSGSGIGALLATLYAAGKTPDQIEWFFYRLLGELEGSSPFTAQWIKIVRRHLLREFAGKTIQSLGKAVVIPLYDRKSQEVVYFQRGQIVTLLLRNFKLYGVESGVRYSTAFQWRVFNSDIYNKMGSELIVGVNAVGEEIKFLGKNEFLFGVMGNLSGKIKREGTVLDLYIALPVDSSFLDSGRRLPEIIRDCRLSSQKGVMQLKQIVLTSKGRYNDTKERED